VTKSILQPQFNALLDEPPLAIGASLRASFRSDPKHLGFTLSRYKFVAKMLAGKRSVLEIGCGTAFGSRVVAHEVQYLALSDFDTAWVEEAIACGAQEFSDGPVQVLDITAGPTMQVFDAIYMLDVIEHIHSGAQHNMLDNLYSSLPIGGVLIIGTPSAESQAYAREYSKSGHVCCYTHKGLHGFLRQCFCNVFMFGMNDEVLHTGFGPMCQYLFAVAVK
jgi:SAM-dependent methyltransferase